MPQIYPSLMDLAELSSVSQGSNLKFYTLYGLLISKTYHEKKNVTNSRLYVDLYYVMNSRLCVDLYCVTNSSLCVDLYCVTNNKLCVDLHVYCVMSVEVLPSLLTLNLIKITSPILIKITLTRSTVTHGGFSVGMLSLTPVYLMSSYSLIIPYLVCVPIN